MASWELIYLESDGFEIKLNFTDTLQVSADDEPDLLLIQLDMSMLTDEHGNSLPASIV